MVFLKDHPERLTAQAVAVRDQLRHWLEEYPGASDSAIAKVLLSYAANSASLFKLELDGDKTPSQTATEWARVVKRTRRNFGGDARRTSAREPWAKLMATAIVARVLKHQGRAGDLFAKERQRRRRAGKGKA